MPFKRSGSPYYQVRRKSLLGYGDTGQLTTGVTSKRIADRMERLLEDLAERALVEPTWYALLDAVCKDKKLPLPDLLAAKNRGRLDALRAGLHDPPLDRAVDELFAARDFSDPNVKLGLDMLLEYARKHVGRNVRLSHVRDGRTLTAICLAAERDPEHPRKRNSVRATLLRGLSHLLRHHVGNAERDRTYAELDFPAEDDTREVHLRPAEIARLLVACDELAAEKGNALFYELRVVARLALQTSADRGTLLAGPWGNGREGEAPGLCKKHVHIFEGEDGTLSGEAFLADMKNVNRPRTVPLTDSLCRELVPLAAGKGPDEPVFSMTYRQMDHLWNQARERGSPSCA